MNLNNLNPIAGGIQGAGQILSAAAQNKASKRQARESKRRTLAELLNAALGRSFEAGESQRKRSSDLSSARANALQNIASQYVQAFR